MSINKLTEFDKVKKDLEELGREFLEKLELKRAGGSVDIERVEDDMVEKFVEILDAPFKEHCEKCLLENVSVDLNEIIDNVERMMGFRYLINRNKEE